MASAVLEVLISQGMLLPVPWYFAPPFTKCMRRNAVIFLFTSRANTEEALTCNVCDRSFPSRRQLADHQQKKRHFGCSACDSLFPSLMALEHHKEEFQHWSDSSYCSHSESDAESDYDPHERNRLL